MNAIESIVFALARAAGATCGLIMRAVDWLTGRRKDWWS